MSDNVQLPATGTGTADVIVATDEGAGGVHVQLVKLAMSADGSVTPVLADAKGVEVQQGTAADFNCTEASAAAIKTAVEVIDNFISGSRGLVTEDNSAAIKTSVELIDDAVKADDAAFTAGTDKVVMSGNQAVAHGSNPDAADAGDAVVALTNRHRIPFMLGGHPNVKSATYLWTGSTTDDNVLAAISSGTKYAITRITITIDQATTVGVAVRLGFGTANVPALPSANADAVDDILFYHPGMVPGSGANVGDGSGILGVGGDGAELRITAGATTSGTGVVTVSYFTIES